jgi:uncharacterized protein YbjT (DUF2867 family)
MNNGKESTMGVTQRKILVTGATGQQGGSLARLMLQKKHKVYGLTRSRDAQSSAIQDLANGGANIIKGDLDDPDSLRQAVKDRDIDSIFLMGTPIEGGTFNTEGEIRRGKLVADIAQENKVEHLVYSSVVNADKNTGIPHFESKYKIEQHIKSLGIPYTIIGPTYFMENLLDPRLGLQQQGQLALPLSPSTILQQIAIQNIAEFSALVIESPERFLGKRIDIASDEVTGQQAAEILSNVLEYKIKYTTIPAPPIEEIARTYEWFEKVGTGIDITGLHREYPTVNWLTFKDWARSKLKS